MIHIFRFWDCTNIISLLTESYSPSCAIFVLWTIYFQSNASNIWYTYSIVRNTEHLFYITYFCWHLVFPFAITTEVNVTYRGNITSPANHEWIMVYFSIYLRCRYEIINRITRDCRIHSLLCVHILLPESLNMIKLIDERHHNTMKLQENGRCLKVHISDRSLCILI